jgi:hypothetical protein
MAQQGFFELQWMLSDLRLTTPWAIDDRSATLGCKEVKEYLGEVIEGSARWINNEEEYGYSVGFTDGLSSEETDLANAQLICLLSEVAEEISKSEHSQDFFSKVKPIFQASSPAEWHLEKDARYEFYRIFSDKQSIFSPESRAIGEFIVAARNALAGSFDK